MLKPDVSHQLLDPKHALTAYRTRTRRQLEQPHPYNHLLFVELYTCIRAEGWISALQGYSVELVLGHLDYKLVIDNLRLNTWRRSTARCRSS